MGRLRAILQFSVFVVASVKCSVLIGQTVPEKLIAPPEFAVVVIVGDDIEISRVIERQEVRKITIKPSGLRIEGAVEPTELTEVVMVPEKNTYRLPLADAIVRRVDGTKLNAEEIRDALKKPVSVVMSRKDARVGDAYSKVLNPKALVVTMTSPVLVVLP
jgi:hypothetical protein